jgi:DNA-binding FadR family transcriptional regulator
VLEITRQRGDTATACPSDVARALADNWRTLMPRVREAASRLAQRGLVEITQGGVVVSPSGPWKGPIRIRKPRG